jgi:hypothetical protein
MKIRSRDLGSHRWVIYFSDVDISDHQRIRTLLAPYRDQCLFTGDPHTGTYELRSGRASLKTFLMLKLSQ